MTWFTEANTQQDIIDRHNHKTTFIAVTVFGNQVRCRQVYSNCVVCVSRNYIRVIINGSISRLNWVLKSANRCQNAIKSA